MNFLIRWSWLLVLGVVAAVAAAVLTAGKDQAMYKSTATLLVVKDPEASERLTNTYAELVKTRPVLDVVRQQVGSNESHEDFSKRITVTTNFNSQLVRITVSHPNRDESARYAAAIAQATLINIDRLVGRQGTILLAEAPVPPTQAAAKPVASRAALAAGLGLLVALSIAIGVESLRTNRPGIEPARPRDISPNPSG